MDYRAAATRQLKEGAAAGSPASNKGGAAVTVQPAAALASAPAATTAPAPAPVTNATPNATTLGVAASGDLNKMKANASGKTNGNSTNNKKTTNFGGSAPLSYAATAAAKKLAATTSAATAAAATAAAAILAASASAPASDSAPAAGVSGTETSSIAVARKNGSVRAAPSQPLTSLVNAKVCLTLINGSTVEGVVFTYDVYSGVVALISETTGDALAEQQQLGQSNGSPSLGGNAKQQQQRTQIHIIKAANIKDLQVTDKSGDLVLPEVRPVAIGVIEARKQRSISQARERAARIGVGVSDVAQSIFEALSRTLPCRWSQNKIVVLDEVVIESPYGVENCRELASGSFSLQRVKKVLQGELNRIAAAQTTNTAAVT
ncbi:hypothetical protein LPJ66_004270 [Kickxella alabastrina]|uniref:Uncharacterized protein n=1 Tax=Kickxella alabastrina TaxID=61397 RepID=A0ACC1IM03_9FUNG|nr:hypothetical protein LPJ66_004270 [Kickxella alabastrina]